MTDSLSSLYTSFTNSVAPIASTAIVPKNTHKIIIDTVAENLAFIGLGARSS
ncbi:hypothetical protein QT971_21090 [Microcoleus sp. herbarium19]|uniref:hypothetical protein n=1 Tax=Microcoleus sp. herbarium13 TaxID=3055438 RepID=UPI002FCEAD1F